MPFNKQFEEKKPDVIAVQYDPMQYLYNCRNFALNTIPYMKDDLDMEEYGVFTDNYKLPEEEHADSDDEEEVNKKADMIKRFNKKIHSQFFPVQWTEAVVNPARLYLISNMMTSTEESQVKI